MLSWHGNENSAVSKLSGDNFIDHAVTAYPTSQHYNQNTQPGIYSPSPSPWHQKCCETCAWCCQFVCRALQSQYPIQAKLHQHQPHDPPTLRTVPGVTANSFITAMFLARLPHRRHDWHFVLCLFLFRGNFCAQRLLLGLQCFASMVHYIPTTSSPSLNHALSPALPLDPQVRPMPSPLTNPLEILPLPLFSGGGSVR